MANTLPYQRHQHIFPNQAKPQKDKTALGDLRQDKRGETTARRPTTQPARTQTPQRAETSDTKTTRTHRGNADNGRTVQLSIWVKPRVKAEIQRLVAQGPLLKGQEGKVPEDKLTVSSVAAALLERAVQGHIDMQYGELLEPVFQNLFDRRMAARDNRLALLLVRNYLVAEQTRGLVTYLASRVPDMTPDILNDILDHTFQEAKKKLPRRSPELEELIREVKNWLVDEERGELEREKRRKGKL